MQRLLSITLLLLCNFCMAQAPATQQTSLGIVVGPDTTIFTGPLMADGRVDYIAALNARDQMGIAPENNAACLLIHIIDPDLTGPIDHDRREKILSLIGGDDNSHDDIPWNPWKGFKHSLPTDDPANPGYVNRIDLAQSHPWRTADMPELAAWLKSNDRALELTARAVRLPHYWIPLIHSSEGSPGLSSSHDLNEQRMLHNIDVALAERAMLSLGDGNPAAALNDLLTCQRLGYLLGHAPEPEPVSLSIAIAFAQPWAQWRVLQDAKLPAAQLRQWSIDMLAASPVASSALPTWQYCRFDFLADLQGVAAAANSQTDPQGLPPIIDWNREMRLGNNFYDELTTDTSGLTPAQRQAAQQHLKDRIDAMENRISASDVMHGNSRQWLFPRAGESHDTYSDGIGTTLLAMTLPSTASLANNLLRANRRTQWTATVAVALAIYRNENGHYPPSLDALIPKYLAKLPGDMPGIPIAYEVHSTGYIIRIDQPYSAEDKARLARENIAYDAADILISADQLP